MNEKEAKAFAENGHDAMWRVSSGMYKILIKDVEGNPTGEVAFKPNRSQRRFIKSLHYRNLILKARQLGFTTLICILWLDYALFNKNVRCGIVAQDEQSAISFFRDKVKFAYDRLDPELKAMFPLASDSANELRFDHGDGVSSSIRVAVSFASATLHRLLVSEYGKICAKYPERATEIVIGTLPTVPTNGLIVIESTGEGSEGDFHDRVKKAEIIEQSGRELGDMDYRLHFFPWFAEPAYTINPECVIISEADKEYFAQKEAEMSGTISDGQRAWYVTKRDVEFSGDQIKMYSQYPSSPNEPFFVSNEGNFHRIQMARVRREKRICNLPVLDIPVNTFWDVGNSDGTSIWFHQQVGVEDRFIDYFEARGQQDTQLMTIVKKLQDKPYVYNKHFLPHDASHKRQNDLNESIEDILKRLGLRNIEIVSKVTTLLQGIQITWSQFASAYFDEKRCAEGINRLDNYKKRHNQKGGWSEDADKSNGCSEGADAFRQWAQAKNAGNVTMSGSEPKKKPRRHIFHMCR